MRKNTLILYEIVLCHMAYHGSKPPYKKWTQSKTQNCETEISKNTDVHTGVYAFYNLVQLMYAEEKTFKFSKKSLTWTLVESPVCTYIQKVNME